MQDSVALAAARVDTVAVPLGLARLEKLGEHQSGAYNFYATRLRRGTIFSDYDLALARALLAWPQAPRETHEIGGGWGSLSLLLAMVGFQATCLEIDPLRFAAAEALRSSLVRRAPEIGRGCRLLNERFPPPKERLSREGRLALITNLVFTTTEAQKSEILAGLTDYRFAIVDIDRFLTVCAPEGRPERLAEFATAGLGGEPFLDLGKTACFYRFAAG